MHHLITPKDDVLIVLSGNLIGVGVVDVIQLALFGAVNLHVFRQERIQAQNRILTVPHYLTIGVSPQQQVGHDRFPIGKAGHFRIWLPVENSIQRVVRCLFLSVISCHLEQVQGKLRHRLRKETHAGIHGCDLHGGFLIHLLAAVGSAEHKQSPGIPDVILDIWQCGSVPRIVESEPAHKAHCLLLLLQLCHLPVTCHHAQPVDVVAIFFAENVMHSETRDSFYEIPLLCHSHLQPSLPPSSSFGALCALPDVY